MAKRYTSKHIQQALTYWRSKLNALNESTDEPNPLDEEDGEDDGEDGEDDGEDDELPIEDADEPDPFSEWNTGSRLARAHRAAVKKTVQLLNDKLLKKGNLGIDAVQIKNSLVDDDTMKGDFESGNKMVVTLRVTVDAAHVKGFRKFLAAVLKESTYTDLTRTAKRLDEGILDMMKAAYKAVGDEKQNAIDRANKELERKIGLAGLQEYFKLLCGTAVAKKLREIEPGLEKDDKENGVAFVYKAAVTIQ